MIKVYPPNMKKIYRGCKRVVKDLLTKCERCRAVTFCILFTRQNGTGPADHFSSSTEAWTDPHGCGEGTPGGEILPTEWPAPVYSIFGCP